LGDYNATTIADFDRLLLYQVPEAPQCSNLLRLADYLGAALVRTKIIRDMAALPKLSQPAEVDLCADDIAVLLRGNIVTLDESKSIVPLYLWLCECKRPPQKVSPLLSVNLRDAGWQAVSQTEPSKRRSFPFYLELFGLPMKKAHFPINFGKPTSTLFYSRSYTSIACELAFRLAGLDQAIEASSSSRDEWLNAFRSISDGTSKLTSTLILFSSVVGHNFLQVNY